MAVVTRCQRVVPILALPTQDARQYHPVQVLGEARNKQRKATVMKRLASLLGCLLIGVALSGCQTTKQSVKLGDCPLTVEAWFPDGPNPTDLPTAMVIINGQNMGTTWLAGRFEGYRYSPLSLKLSPGTYEVAIFAKGYETNRTTVTLIGKEHAPLLRLKLEPMIPIVGVWNVQYSSGVTRKYDFARNGDVKKTEGDTVVTGKYKNENTGFLVYVDGAEKLEFWEPQNATTWNVGHYFPASNYPKGSPAVTGIATRQ